LWHINFSSKLLSIIFLSIGVFLYRRYITVICLSLRKANASFVEILLSGIQTNLKMKKTIFSFFPLILIACTQDKVGIIAGTTEGYAPVYALTADVTQVSFEAARNTGQAVKIYAFGNYIFQNDVNKGIHIINNSDKKHPLKIGFIKLPYSTEIAVKGSFLYANNFRDLVVFDISDVNKPMLVKRIPNVFPMVNQEYPPQQNTAFECPDPNKGVVVSWEKKTLTDPKCRR
jgi:hypothetical protein